MLSGFRQAWRWFVLFILSACITLSLALYPFSGGTVGSNDFYGMHVGYDAYPPKAIPVLNDLDVKWVRAWVNVDWGDRNNPDSFQNAKDYKAAGFKVIMVFNQPRVPSYQEVKDYFDWVQTVPGMTEAIDVWEILNELNLPEYWQGTADQYVNQVLKPAWDSLHPKGESVLGGSFTAYQNSGNTKLGTKVTKNYLEAGYLDYVDYGGSHPYTEKVSEMKKHLGEVKKLYGSTPIILSEWNFKQQNDYDRWVSMLNEVRPFVEQRVSTACYYRILDIEDQGGWPGVVTSNSEQPSYVPVEPFYSMYKNWS